MRATIAGIEVDGTPQEIAAIIREMGNSASNFGGARAKIREVGGDGQVFVAEDVAYRALTRRPLSAAQKKLLKALLKEPNKWVSATKLHSHLDYNGNQLGGLFGGLGRRLSSTDGYESDTFMFDTTYDSDKSEYCYRLPASVQAALGRIEL